MLGVMHTDLWAIVFGLGAGIGWGFSGFFDAKASKNVGPIIASVLINCIVAAWFAVLYFLVLPHNHPTDTTGIWLAVASGATITIGALSYFRGLAIGPVSLVSPLSASYPLVTTLAALVIFNAHLGSGQLVGICMILVGVLAASGLWRVHLGIKDISRGPVLGLFTSLAWGAGYALASQAISRLGWQFASLVEFGAMALAFCIFVPFAKGSEQLPLGNFWRGLSNKYILLSGTISTVAAVSLNVGLAREHSSGAIISALSACYPVLTVLLARRSFAENVARIPLAGAFLSIAGVIVVSLSR